MFCEGGFHREYNKGSRNLEAKPDLTPPGDPQSTGSAKGSLYGGRVLDGAIKAEAWE